MQLKLIPLTSLLLTFLSFLNLAAACLTVDFVYDNDGQRVAWLVAHDNGVLVMSLGGLDFPRNSNRQQTLTSQVAGWYGSLRNDGNANWFVQFETAAGITTAFALSNKRCTSAGGPNGCHAYWIDGRKWC